MWTPSAVTSLNPATGQTWWREELVTREDCAVATPVCFGVLLLISGLMFRLDPDKPGASIIWPEKKPMAGRVLSHTSMPMILDDHVFAGKMGGRLVCLEARTGKQLWETDQVTKRAHCATIHLTRNGDSMLLFTAQGNLIAHGSLRRVIRNSAALTSSTRLTFSLAGNWSGHRPQR